MGKFFLSHKIFSTINKTFEDLHENCFFFINLKKKQTYLTLCVKQNFFEKSKKKSYFEENDICKKKIFFFRNKKNINERKFLFEKECVNWLREIGKRNFFYYVDDVGRFNKYRRIRQIVDRSQGHSWITEKLGRIEVE